MVRRRRRLILPIALAAVLFLVVSALLARALSVDGAERSAITAVIEAEARGDRAGVIDRIQGCAPEAACRAAVTGAARPLRRSGAVSVIQIQTSAGFSLGSTLGTARAVWSAGSSLPIVQCLRVRHAGNVLSGFRVELLALSARIKSDAACPARIR